MPGGESVAKLQKLPPDKYKSLRVRISGFFDYFVFLNEDLHIDGTGVSNKLILENLQKLSDNFDGDITIRIPVMNGFNDDINEMKKIGELIQSLKIKNVELLLYHKMGEHKYDALNMNIIPYNAPTQEQINMYKNIFIK